MKLRLLAAILVLAVLCGPAQAQGLNFTFTFIGTSSNPSYSGPITGEIYGLTDNSYGKASKVSLFSAPVGFGVTTPVDFPSDYTFGVFNGAITYANYDQFNLGTFFILSLEDDGHTSDDYLEYEGNGVNPSVTSSAPTTSNLAGTFTPAPVPEANQYGLVVLLFIAGLVAGKKIRDQLRSL